MKGARLKPWRPIAAARSALAEAWDGVAPVDMGTGGSIPFIAEFQEMFPGASILVTGDRKSTRLNSSH